MKQEQRELEKIAEESKGIVRYETEEQEDENVLEYFFYNDDNFGITARNDTFWPYNICYSSYIINDFLVIIRCHAYIN